MRPRFAARRRARPRRSSDSRIVGPWIATPAHGRPSTSSSGAAIVRTPTWRSPSFNAQPRRRVALEVGQQRVRRGQRDGREGHQLAERGDLGRRIVGERQQGLADPGGVHRDVGPRRLVEAQWLRGVDVEHDQHLVADPGAEAHRLPARRGERVEVRLETVEADPGLGAATEGDEPRAEVVAVRAGVLGDEPVAAQRLQEAVGRAVAELGARGDVADAEVVVGRRQAAQHRQRPLDRL